MSWSTWSPFRSRQVRDICDHLTEDERKRLNRRGATYGLWVLATLTVPISEGVRYHSNTLLLVAGVMIAVNIAGAVVCQSRLRRFLASTEWAASSGYKAKDLRLFRRS